MKMIKNSNVSHINKQRVTSFYKTFIAGENYIYIQIRTKAI